MYLIKIRTKIIAHYYTNIHSFYYYKVFKFDLQVLIRK